MIQTAMMIPIIDDGAPDPTFYQVARITILQKHKKNILQLIHEHAHHGRRYIVGRKLGALKTNQGQNKHANYTVIFRHYKQFSFNAVFWFQKNYSQEKPPYR